MTDARATVAAALRRLGHALIAREADDGLLLRLAADVDRAREDVESRPPRQRDLDRMLRTWLDQDVPDGGPMQHFSECFVSGAHNPMGIAISVRREGDEAVADVVLGAAFEGAPGRAHGGIVAAVFDDVIGYLLTVHDVPGFTGELAVRYLAPTPIGVPLVVRARATQRVGRRIVASSEATTADGRVVARADATLVVVAHLRGSDGEDEA